jgi:hypothetical protein
VTWSALTAVIGRVPVDIGRDQAAAAAQAELAKPAYQAARPSLVEQVTHWLDDLVARVVRAVAAVGPGGIVGLLALAAVVVLIVVLVRWRVGPLRRSDAADRSVFVGQVRSAAAYRADADRAAASGDWDQAVRQRFRALVRGLEERDLLDMRPGRTADEAAAEAARLLPAVAQGLMSAARIFDDVAYGSVHADAAADRTLRDVDEQVAGARVARVELTGAGPAAGGESLR